MDQPIEEPTGRVTGEALPKRGEAVPLVVVDTNVFVAAAFKPGSDSARVVDAIRAGEVRLLWSEATRREVASLMRKIPPISWETVADLFRDADRGSSAIDPATLIAVEDPEDRKFAALAGSHGATLVSMDRHLLGARLDGRCAVCTPSEFMKRLGEAE